MTNPTIAAAIAINNTAPAAKSFVRLIASLYSGETKSARASMDELTASAANTALTHDRYCDPFHAGKSKYHSGDKYAKLPRNNGSKRYAPS